MKLQIKPGNLLERIALTFNLVPTPLIDTQVAFNAARAIMTAAELGLFEAIGKSSKSSEQIANTINTHPAATKFLLDCLVGMGYLHWSEKNYSLKPKFYKWLLKEYPSNLIGKLRFQLSEWNWMANLEEFVKTGKPMDVHEVMSKDEWAQYQEGMRNLSINSAKELAGKLRLQSNATKMLDIGGSHGLFSIELCKKNPLLSSTILELPGAIDSASAIALEFNLADRVKYKSGNAITDDLGENEYDLVMINNVVPYFTADENRTLAKKVARALKPGGIYAIGEFIRSHKPGEGGIVPATVGLYYAMTSSSGTWSSEEIQSWQDEAGLKRVKAIGLMTLPGWKMSLAYK